MDFNPDAFLAAQESVQAPAASAHPSQAPAQATEGFDPDSFIQDTTEEKYGGGLNQVKAGLSGIAEGVAGPLVPLVRTKVFGENPDDIRGQNEANAGTHGIGEALGLTGGALTGTGEAAVMGKVGELAAGAAGLNELGEGASLGYKVGSSAVKQAAEMAVLQGSDETSKTILQDPEVSAQSALANIGMAAAFGGAGGAFVTGAVSPLWDATAGPKLESFLSGLRNHLDGTSLRLPEGTSQAIDTLGINVSPATKAAMSGDPKAAQLFNELRESQHPEILSDIKNLRQASQDSVLQSLGVAPEAVENYSENDAGHAMFDTFKNEYKQKYEPIAKALDERNEIASTIPVSDAARMGQYGQLIEKGMNNFGTDSPLYKQYENWGNRLLAKETIGGLDQVKTELGNELKTAYRQGDANMIKALSDIKGSIHDFQESQIAKQSAKLEMEGAEHGKAIGRDIINSRADVNRNYSEFAKMSNDLAGHLSVGEFKGFNSLTNKLGDKVSAETLLKKFSPKNNADIIPFLQQHFPETLEAVRQNEIAQIIKPAVLGAKGEESIDMNRLAKTVQAGLAGKSEYMKWAMSPEALQKIQAADTLARAIPGFKSSGTAGWMMKLTKSMPASAMAGVGLLMGHNPIGNYLVGEATQHLGTTAPNAIKLGMLKFMASDQPVEAKGFKAMAEFFHNSMKGENLLTKAVSNTLKSGAQVLTSDQMPNKADKERLDKIVSEVEERPEILLRQANGHTGHYLPDHQQEMARTSTAALKYLSGLKPKPFQPSPLDKPIAPSPTQMARYDRALDIAQQPAIVMQHIKDGTLQASDIADLNGMYPALYRRMSFDMTQLLTHRHDNEEPIPYKQRVGMGLFLGQALDVSMTPASILAAQPVPPQGAPQQGAAKGRPSALKGKSTNMYKTATQSAEGDRSDRD